MAIGGHSHTREKKLGRRIHEVEEATSIERDSYRKERSFPRESGLPPNLLSFLPVVSPVEFIGISGSCAAFLSVFQHSPSLCFTDTAGGLHQRACPIV